MQRIGLDLDLFRRLSNLQLHVHVERRVDVQGQIGSPVRLESALLHINEVLAEREGLKGIEAVAVGGLGQSDAGADVGGRHGGSRNGRPALIFYGSGNTGGHAGERRSAQRHHDRKESHSLPPIPPSPVHIPSLDRSSLYEVLSPCAHTCAAHGTFRLTGYYALRLILQDYPFVKRFPA